MLKSNEEWEQKAQIDPLHAVSSEPGRRKGEASEWRPDEFFKKGEQYLTFISPLLANVAPDSEVLDIGCGAGRISRALSKRFRSVTGVDVSETMIKKARELCADVTNARFLLGDGVRLPVPDGSMDAIVSMQVIQHIDKQGVLPLLKDCARALRPGGMAVLHIPAPDMALTIRSMLTGVAIRRRLTSFVKRNFPQVDITRKGFVISQYHTYSPQLIRKWFEESGFRVIDTIQFRPGKPTSTVYGAQKL